MLTFYIRPSTTHGEYEASDANVHGTRFKIFGRYERKDDGSVRYSFSLNLVQWDGRDRNSASKDAFFLGTLQDDGMTLSGSWGYGKDSQDQRYHFLFKRIDPNVLVARPPPEDFKRDRMKALWNYALTAARNEARRKLDPWSFTKERLHMMEQYQLLSQAAPSRDSLAALQRILARSPPEDFKGDHIRALLDLFKSSQAEPPSDRLAALQRKLTHREVRTCIINARTREQVNTK